MVPRPLDRGQTMFVSGQRRPCASSW
jgi:hypothetical protein